MTEDDEKNDADAIREIIEADEQKALDRFRSSRFGERLKFMIREQTAAQPGPARVSPTRPVWVSLAVLIVATAAAVWFLRPRPGAIRSASMVETRLHGLPGLQAIENPPSPLTRGSSLPASPFEKDMTSVLSVSRGPGGAPGPARGRGFSAIDPASEPLGLEKAYEFLVIDKSVERVLTDISPKSKEG